MQTDALPWSFHLHREGLNCGHQVRSMIRSVLVSSRKQSTVEQLADAQQAMRNGMTLINHPTVDFLHWEQSLGSFTHIPYLSHQQDRVHVTLWVMVSLPMLRLLLAAPLLDRPFVGVCFTRWGSLNKLALLLKKASPMNWLNKASPIT